MRRERERPPQSGSVDVSIVIPAHNEEGNVGPLLDQFGELARKARFSFEVVMVDDGSRDRTLPRLVDAQRVHRFVRIVSLPRRRGLTEALQAGFSAARAPVLVFYPADRQFHPNDIPRMIDRLREGYDLVTGRKIGQYNKRVVSGLYNRISRWLFPSINVTDLNSVKAFRRELIDVFDYRHDWHRFWVAIAAEAGYRIGEVDVTLYRRTTGYSKFGWWRIPGGVLDLLAVKFQYHTMRRPLWYFGMTGTILFAAALVIGAWAFYLRFFLDQGYRPLLYLVMMLGTTSVVFFALGFLAEAVAGVRQLVESLRGGPRFQLYHPPAGRSEPPRPEAATPPEVPRVQPASASPSVDARSKDPRGDRRRAPGDRRRPDRHPRGDAQRSADGHSRQDRPADRTESIMVPPVTGATGESKARPAEPVVPDPIPSPPAIEERQPLDVDLFDQPETERVQSEPGRAETPAVTDASDRGEDAEPEQELPLPKPPARPSTPFGRRNRR